MVNNGIPADQIITFSYDDVATAKQNPFPGQLFNQPDGPDVYEGCNIDYRGADVTPEKFLSVLRGEDQNGGKTLKTTSEDKVFINFSDHGAPGLIAFPKGTLYAKDFIATLDTMYENDSYKEMLIYIEACESGSMFENLLSDDKRIYATTAANSVESSWGYYCSPDDKVNGKHVGSCLGDLYSIVWMEDSDEKDACTETVGEQFDIVKAKTTKSHVMEFGDLSIKKEPVGNFDAVCAKRVESNIFDSLTKLFALTGSDEMTASAVDSRDIKLHYLYHRYLRTGDRADAIELEHEISHRSHIENRFESLKSVDTGILFSEESRILKDAQAHTCYIDLADTYHDICGRGEYDLKYYHNFVSLCNSNRRHEDLIAMVSTMC